MVEVIGSPRVIYDAARITDPFGAPTLMGTHVGYIDVLAGEVARIWWCLQHPQQPNGEPGICELIVKICCPMETLIQSRMNVTEWINQRSMQAQPAPIPPGTRLM